MRKLSQPSIGSEQSPFTHSIDEESFQQSRSQVLNISQGTQRNKIINMVSNIASRIPKDIVLVVLLIVAFSAVVYCRQTIKIYKEPLFKERIISVGTETKIEKILWLYTDFNLQGEKMLEQVMGHYLIHVAEKSGWEVRKVTSRTAYEYISPEINRIITSTMQHTLIEEKVDDLLRLALLLDNGGVMVRVTEALPVENLQWLKDHFVIDQDQLTEGKHNDVLLFKSPDAPGGEFLYQDYFLASTKRNELLVDVFQAACEVISTGIMKFGTRPNFYINHNMNSTKVNRLTRTILRFCLDRFGPAHYQVKFLHSTHTPQRSIESQLNNKVSYLRVSKEQYHSKFGRPNHFIYFPTEQYRVHWENELEKTIDQVSMGGVEDSYWADLMMVPYNQGLYEVIEPRPVHYCIIDAHQHSDYNEIRDSFESLKKQSYHQWTAVYFSTEDVDETQSAYVDTQKKDGFNIVISKRHQSVGRNYQVGIIKICPDKSFIFVLKAHERLASQNSLESLVDKVQPRDVLGAYVTLNVSGDIKTNSNDFQDYVKQTYNGAHPQYEKLAIILNHLRVFHSDSYKILPQFELRTIQNQYFDDRFIFLQNFVGMTVRTDVPCDITEFPHEQRIKWFIKSSRHLFDVPFFIVFHNPPLIMTNTYEQVNKTQLEMNFFKNKVWAMKAHLNHLMQNGQAMKELAVFNPGDEYVPYTMRDKPQRIPKIFHQIWIGGQIPQGKKVIMQANRELYPDWEHKLWRNEDITRENFPLCYDLIQTLFKVDNFTRFSRMATVADVLRHEIMYNYGGFYMDTSMKLFSNVFNEWLSYRVVIPTLDTVRYRWVESMCIFANEPKYPGLLRIISSYNTNRYNIFHKQAQQIAGPYDFIQFIQGYEEYDPDVLIMGFDKFYPIDYRIEGSIYSSLCATWKNFLHEGDEVSYQFLRWGEYIYVVKNCGRHYPYSYGKEVQTVGGGTWFQPRW